MITSAFHDGTRLVAPLDPVVSAVAAEDRGYPVAPLPVMPRLAHLEAEVAVDLEGAAEVVLRMEYRATAKLRRLRGERDVVEAEGVEVVS